MSIQTWAEVVETLQPYVFKISTPGGFGTGFALSRHAGKVVCAVATAAHVIDHAHFWEEPIRLEHVASKKIVVARPAQRAIFLDEARDTAAILFEPGEMPVPDAPLRLGPQGYHFRVGNEVGWVGFPAVAASTLCFFSGRVSAWLPDQSSYLIDGVAINGVSGGPAVQRADGPPILVGVVSAYIPNRATGEALPGLAVVRDISHFHELAPKFASLDEAKAEETPADTPPPPSPDAPDAT